LPPSEAPLAHRAAIWIEERIRSEPRKALWPLSVAWKVLLGIVSYPYIRIHSRYRQYLDRKWRQRQMQELRKPLPRRRGTGSAERGHYRASARIAKFRTKPRSKFDRLVGHAVNAFEKARKIPSDLIIHAFHYTVCHWPRPRDLSKAVPSEIVKPLPFPRSIPNSSTLPRISIVTPSYGYGHFIEWTIRSVLMQGYPKLELVVMDGASPDNTAEIIHKYRPYLKHGESKKDKGQADAVVRGFEHTTGEIMAYLNSDDLLAPGALEFVARFFREHPEVDMVYSHRVIVNDENIVTGHWVVPPHSDWFMQRWDYIPQETCFWRRSMYEKVGGIDASYKFALDFDLFVRFMRAGAKIHRADRFLGAFRVHDVSKTSSQMEEGKVHPEVLRVWTKYKVQLARWQEMPAVGIREYIDIQSRRFAASGKMLPGVLPGIGYDYNRAWDGLLTSDEPPPCLTFAGTAASVESPARTPAAY
jgi:glycosyltransferase involved in cell wall biosynthesis